MTDVQLTPTLRKLRVTFTTDTGRQRFIVSDASVVYNDLRSWQPGEFGDDPPDPTAPGERGSASPW